MRLFGVTFGQFVKIGLIAVLFIFLAKWLLPKLRIGGLNAFLAQV